MLILLFLYCNFSSEHRFFFIYSLLIFSLVKDAGRVTLSVGTVAYLPLVFWLLLFLAGNFSPFVETFYGFMHFLLASSPSLIPILISLSPAANQWVFFFVSCMLFYLMALIIFAFQTVMKISVICFCVLLFSFRFVFHIHHT